MEAAAALVRRAARRHRGRRGARLSRGARHQPRRRRRKFGFGFAPDSRGKLKAALKQFGNDKLVEAGLLIAPEDEQASPMTASAAG